ncbi:hypothetical protein OG233_30480 [Streptomyces sp. NBC_01218]|uniref:hypothetical protein n=1 Tax=unclassified Streptomyces TaxID=2593676 RepID=UPI0023B8EFAE|nr:MULTISPECIES: hypothetical protein [unclassified Streptomyces]WEH38054.1 hypothetical protein PZB77_00175 [Streptomyces sp. AM 2-1-1]WEH43485.1 hypothetical protein PZB77_30605 [Streptomyces sp. AM 2-1-1]WSQ49712.1 hypothetical protein OG233_00175 [Streptomyces sp. NBC_01218]WSQ55129.1 hypothetical protein OG233_30480 [Streptomyces sp. NBC_01218]
MKLGRSSTVHVLAAASGYSLDTPRTSLGVALHPPPDRLLKSGTQLGDLLIAGV